MLSAARELQLLGLDDSLLGADYVSKITQCANLKLLFNFDGGEVTQKFSNGPSGIGGLGFTSTDSHVQANGLQLDPKFLPIHSREAQVGTYLSGILKSLMHHS